MSSLVEISAVVRGEVLPRVIFLLREAGVPRMTVVQAHAIGRGVDPASARLAMREGAEYADKAKVQFVCAGERQAMYVELLCEAARTGRQGDGIVYVQPVLSVTKIRTGVEGTVALE